MLDGSEDEAKRLYDAGKVEYLIFRFYNADVMAIDPYDWVRVCLHWLTLDRGGWRLIDIVDEVVLDNELNLPYEHSNQQPDAEGHSWWCTEEGYRAIDDYKVHLAVAWEQQTSGLSKVPKLAWGAIAPSHDPRTGSFQHPEGEYELLRNSLDRVIYAVVHVHSYGDPDDEWFGGRYRRVKSAILSKQDVGIFRLTEWNWLTATQEQIQKALRILREIDCYYFLWSSAADDHLAFELLTSPFYPIVYEVQNIEPEVPSVPTVDEIIALQLAIQTDSNDLKVRIRERAGDLADTIIGMIDPDLVEIQDKAGQSVNLLNQLPK